jgi:membrane dipeptidase
MTQHLEYAVELVGIDHVGVSTDFSFDYADAVDEFTHSTNLFDDSYTRWGPIQRMPPETLLRLDKHLARRGWSNTDINAVCARNFHRVAQRAWKG